MRYSAVLLLSFLLKTNSGFSQWVQTDGPYGTTTITALFQHDTTLFAAANCGYFSKSDTADRWSLHSTLNFTNYTLIGDNLFVGNAGIKLVDLANPDNPPLDISSIATNCLAHSDTCLYTGNDAGFFKSSDNGQSWNSYSDGLPIDTFYSPWGNYYYKYVLCIEVTTNYIYCGTTKGVFRNTGNLNTWVEINSGLPIEPITFIKEIDGVLYSGIGNKLFSSNTFGNSWIEINSAPSKVTCITKVTDTYYTGTDNNGVFYSIDNGANWNSLNTGLTDLSITTLSDFDTTVVCGTNTKGVFYLQNNYWINNRPGMICSNIRSMTTIDSFVVINTEPEVYISNAFNGWNKISPNVIYETFGSVSSMNDTIFLSVEYNSSSWPYDAPFILFSADNGNNWSSLTNSPLFAGDDPYSIYCENNRLYAFENDKLNFTDNLGSTWSDLSLPPQYCNGFNDFQIINAIPYAAACGNAQLIKIDNTSNWILSNYGLPTDREVLSIAYCDGAIFACVLVHGMYVSIDDGNNWTPANNGLILDYGIYDFINYYSSLFVSSQATGVFFTSNNGQNWYECNDGLQNKYTTPIKILNDTLYVGTLGNGVWKRPVTDLNLSTPHNENVDEFVRIFPNPASDFIQLSAGAAPINSVSIYDISGKQVLSERVNSKNMIDISGIENGMYIVSVWFENNVQISKLIIAD